MTREGESDLVANIDRVLCSELVYCLIPAPELGFEKKSSFLIITHFCSAQHIFTS